MRALILLLLAAPAMAAQTWPAPEGSTFTNDTGSAIQLVMCNKDLSGCGNPRTIAPGESQNCGWWIFNMPPPPAGTYPRICALFALATPRVPIPFQSCYPDIDIRFTWAGPMSTNYWWIDVPASVGSTYAHFGMWRDCNTGKVTGQFFNYSDVLKLISAGINSSDAANQYAKTQPVEEYTAAELAFRKAALAVWNDAAPTPPPAPVFKVAKDGTKPTRPVYAVVNGARKITASGALAAKVGDVKIGATCDAALTVEVKFMGVSGLPNEAKPGALLPANTVALCE